MVSGMPRLGAEEGFNVVEGGIECGGRTPAPRWRAGEIEMTKKLLIVLSNLEMLGFVRHD